MNDGSRWRWKHGLFTWPAPFHPLLAPVPALLSFTHDNHDMAPWRLVLLPLALTWAASLPVFFGLAFLSRNPRTAAVAVTLLAGAFHAHDDVGAGAAWMWVAVGVATVLLVRHRGDGDVLTTLANALVGFALLPAVWTTWQDETAREAPYVRPDAAPLATPGPAAPLPDIWYFVLDGYGREDVLREHYGVKEGLPAALRARGFYVAEAAHSNYSQTALSFASALNMASLDALLSDLDPASKNRRPLLDLVRDNRVTRTLRAAGYRVVQYPGEYSMAHVDADEDRGALLRFNEFDYVLWGRTPLLALTQALGWPAHRVCHEVRRRAIDAVLDDLPRGDRDPGPTFVYVHIVAPHPPFVFAADGSYRRTRSRMFFGDGSTWDRFAKKYGERYDAGYRAQVRYLDRRMTDAIDGILAHAERPPIILVQGDHGPGLHLEWGDPVKTDMRERMGILSAYLVPDPAALYPSITPLNSFPVVLEQALGVELPRGEDRSWFSSFKTPYDLLDVTDRLAAPAP